MTKTKSHHPLDVRGSDSGVTILSALVALTLLGIVVAIAAGSLRSTFSADKRVRAKRAAADYDQTLKQLLYDATANYFSPVAGAKCASTSALLGAPYSLGAGVSVVRSANIPPPPGALPPWMAAAIQRCRSTTIPTANSKLPFHYCLLLTTNPANAAVSSDSLARADRAFVEVRYQVTSQSGAPAPCNQATRLGIGGNGYYTVYWATKTGSKNEYAYSLRTDSFSVAACGADAKQCRQ